MVNIDVDKNNAILDQFFTTRIFRNDPAMRFVGRVHEQLQNIEGRKNCWYQVEPNEIKLLHTGYSSKIIRQKCERNLPLLLDELRKNPKNSNLYRYLADVYCGLDDYDQAIKYARLDIATGRKELAYASRSYRVLLNALRQKKANFSTIEAVVKDAIAAFPTLPDFYSEYALMFFMNDQYDKAETLLEKALALYKEYDGIETTIFHTKFSTTYLILGIISEHKNEYAKAIEFYQKSLEDDKYIVNVFGYLYNIISHEDPVYCIAFLNMIYNKTNKLDLEFLITTISKLKRGKVLAYYLQAKNRLLECTDIDVLALECVGNYKKVESLMTQEVMEEVVFTACSAILLDDAAQIGAMIEYLPENYQNVVQRYYEKTPRQLESADFSTYQIILLELLQTAEFEIMARYCLCAKEFPVIQILLIAKVLKDHSYFKQAVLLYQKVLSFHIVDGKRDIVYELAYCYYKLKNYTMASQYFQQAMDLGYVNNEVQTLAKWSNENLLNRVELVNDK
jgi:tetratricopeptide (TPR) repeat protein